MEPRVSVSDEDIRSVFRDGPLGVLVTHAESRPLLDDLVAEASRLGIAVEVFFMDEGVRLLADHGWVTSLPDGRYSACDLSIRLRDVEPPQRVTAAGQYHNAMMVSDAARVVSL